MLKKLGIICTTLNNNKIILIEDVFKSLTSNDVDAVRIFLLNLKYCFYIHQIHSIAFAFQIQNQYCISSRNDQKTLIFYIDFLLRLLHRQVLNI